MHYYILRAFPQVWGHANLFVTKAVSGVFGLIGCSVVLDRITGGESETVRIMILWSVNVVHQRALTWLRRRFMLRNLSLFSLPATGFSWAHTFIKVVIDVGARSIGNRLKTRWCQITSIFRTIYLNRFPQVNQGFCHVYKCYLLDLTLSLNFADWK